jgi:DNA-binding CsgD family transcriptional regulator
MAEESFIILSYFICCISLISFSIYNLYIYFVLKDKAYLYYVIVQMGSLLFFIGDNLYFNVLSPLRIYYMIVVPDGIIRFFEINIFFEYIGVAVLFWGFIQFTRSYLGIQSTLPILDTILRVLAPTFVFVEVVPPLLTLSGLAFSDMSVLANIFILVIIAACLGTAIVAYTRKIRVARHFLIANLLPAVFAIGASVHNLVYSESSTILPTLAILSQIFTFAVALVARIKLINDDLNRKAEEAMKLQMEMTAASYERLLIDQRNVHMKLTMEMEKEKNELLQQKLETNQRELMGNSLHIHQKNKILSDLKAQLQHIDPLNSVDRLKVLKDMKSSLNDSQYLDEKWDDFKLHFEQVHPSFFENLIAAHPSLTTYELRLYAYFHINLSTKEIAALLNIAPASVRQAKTRLHKKMRSV